MRSDNAEALYRSVVCIELQLQSLQMGGLPDRYASLFVFKPELETAVVFIDSGFRWHWVLEIV